MKKTNKLSETSKKAIRYIAFATGLMVAALPGKSKADLLNFNADVNVLGLAGVSTGVNVGHAINAYAGANALGIGGSTGVSVGNGSLVDVNADANVGPLAGANAGLSVGNGVNAYVGGNVIGVAGSTGISVASSGSTAAYAYPTTTGYYTTMPTRPVSYASMAVTQPRVQYVQPAVRYVRVAGAQPVRYVSASSYRPAPVAYQTAQAPVTSQGGQRVEVQTYDSYAHESEDSQLTQTVQKRYVEDPENGYREQEVHARKVIIKRRVYYTYE